MVLVKASSDPFSFSLSSLYRSHTVCFSLSSLSLCPCLALSLYLCLFLSLSLPFSLSVPVSLSLSHLLSLSLSLICLSPSLLSPSLFLTSLLSLSHLFLSLICLFISRSLSFSLSSLPPLSLLSASFSHTLSFSLSSLFSLTSFSLSYLPLYLALSLFLPLFSLFLPLFSLLSHLFLSYLPLSLALSLSPSLPLSGPCLFSHIIDSSSCLIRTAEAPLIHIKTCCFSDCLAAVLYRQALLSSVGSGLAWLSRKQKLCALTDPVLLPPARLRHRETSRSRSYVGAF